MEREAGKKGKEKLSQMVISLPKEQIVNFSGGLQHLHISLLWKNVFKL